MLTPWKKSYDQPRQHIQKQRHYFVNKGLSSQGYGFSNSHVWMWELDYKKSWVPKNWCFWTVVSDKTLESLLDCKEIKPVNPKGNQPWIFIGRTDAEAEAPIHGYLMWSIDSLEKTLMLGKTEGKRRRDDRGQDSWMASPTQCTWIWASSGRWWRTGKPGVLESMESMCRVRHDWVTEQQISTITLNINGLLLQLKDKEGQNAPKKQDPTVCCLQAHLKYIKIYIDYK